MRSRRNLLLLSVAGLLCAACAFVARCAPSRMSTSSDLYIVGAGYLGILVGQEWRTAFPRAKVFGETRSEARHEELQVAGITPTLRAARSGAEKFPNVVFCAAPSGNLDYAGEVAAAAHDLWDGTGNLVFTSSGGIYQETDGSAPTTEDSPVSDSPRATKLLDSEAACRRAGGCVIRLAGLYSLERGPHSFWLARGEVAALPDGVVNLLSYADAAAAVAAAAARGRHGATYLAADGRPTTRLEVCDAARGHPMYAGVAVPAFQAASEAVAGGDGRGGGGSGSKRYDCSKTQAELGWKPRHASFAEFMAADAAAALTAAGSVRAGVPAPSSN